MNGTANLNKLYMEIPLTFGKRSFADRDDNNDEFDADKAGFNLAFEFYVKEYVADPNVRDTMVQALNIGTFRFIIALEVAKHISRLRTIFQYLPRLPGDAVVNMA